jgi:hypothetical protein
MKKTEPSEELTAKQAAELAGVDSKTIRRWLADDLITGHQLPGGSKMPSLISKSSLLLHLSKKADQVVS